MIDPKDISSASEYDELLRGTRIRVSLKMSGEAVSRGRDPEQETDATRRLKVQAWNAIYGDIDRKLEEMRRKILSGVGMMPGGYEQANAAINEVQAMVHNPFYA